MRFYHVSPSRNNAGIKKHGLLTAKSKGRLKAVWLVEEDRVEWAILHCAARHKVRPSSLTVIVIEFESMFLRKSGRPGLWYSLSDLPRTLFVGSFTEQAWVEQSVPQGDAESELLQRMEDAEHQANAARG